MARLTGLVVSERPSGPSPASLSVAIFYRAALLGQSGFVEQRWPIGDDGQYSIDLPDEARKDERTRLAVVAPSGETIVSHALSELIKDDGGLAKISLPADFVPPRVKPREPAPQGEPERIFGRLFRPGGGAVGKQAISVYGRRDDGERFVLFAGSTDAAGYFAGTTVRGTYVAADAEVGGDPRPVVLPVALADGTLPKPLLLIDDAAPADDHDCACAATPPATPDAAELADQSEAFSADLGGNCADFTVPNRTLEEFTFHKIVRTTDPQIKGLTLPDGVRDPKLIHALFGATFEMGKIAGLLNASDFEKRDLQGNADAKGVAVAMQMVKHVVEGVGDASLPDRPIAQDTPVIAYRDTAALEANGVAAAARWDDAFETRGAQTALAGAAAHIAPDMLHAALADPDGFTPAHLMMLERRGAITALKTYLDFRRKPVPGRGALTESNPVDWDDTPEFYQATSIAHGHILTLKQEWKADGYSLGELVKSLPLAPGQKKQIAIVDWDRRDTASRTETEDEAESLVAELSRERDINEIANAAFHESIRGGSKASTGAVGGGIGFAIGPLVIGGGGGAGWSSSSAWQDSSRNVSGSTLQQLRDDTSQGASSVRSQRSTVIEVVGQRERQTTTTEVIANHNRCHAVTIQYFEVLRHFAVQERIAGVRECLFIPLQMKLFDATKALRWRTILTQVCRNRALRRNFDSVQRLSTVATTPPDRAFADDPIEELSGTLSFRVSIARPKDPDDLGKIEVEQTAWRFVARLLGISPQALYERYRRNDAKKDQIYREEIAPEVARKYLESLQIMLVDRDGNKHDAGFGITVLSRYSDGGIMQIALNDQGASPRLTRRDIVGVEIGSSYELPEFSKSVLETARVDYVTERMAYWLVRNDRVLDDVATNDSAYLSTSALSAAEERNQLKEDRERQRALIKHLNANIEYYHRAIWLHMDANRRYMLLDGFEAPNSGGRSVASVVENRVIGVVGNALVMPVSPGHQLDPVLRKALKAQDDPQKVLEALYDVAPVPPRRLSVPTKGVFAESMMGKCDSCEVIEEDRFWRWTNYPLPDSPPPIAPVSTGSRFAATGDLTPSAFPNALVGFQTIPNAPLPTAMSAALGLLGKNVFKDMTGLTENQKNAMAALTTALSSSESFAGEAFQLSMAEQASRNLDRSIDQIGAAKAAGYLTDDEASAATRDALLAALGKPQEGDAEDVTKAPAVEKAVEKASTTPGGSATITRSVGDGAESVAFSGGPADLTIGAAGVAHIIDLKDKANNDIFLSTPAIKDSKGSPGGVMEIKRSRDLADMQMLFLEPAKSGGHDVLIDLFPKAKVAGFAREDPTDATKVEFKTRIRAGYPARASDKTKLVKLKAGRKYPVVIILHGQADGWHANGPFTLLGTAGGFPVLEPTSVDSIANHAGYEYLQLFLADASRQIVTFSIETNAANGMEALIDMRAEMMLDAVQKIRDLAADPASPFHDMLDFDNVGLVGHSRGGDAVVRAIELNAARGAGKKLGIKAVCSLAPTDYRGSSSAPPSIIAAPNLSYLVVHGGLDGDVSGARVPGQLDWGGTGMRHYDRALADKVIAWIPAAIHDHFNTVWSPNVTAVEWPGGIPAGALKPGEHQTLANEYIGQFFDMTLNRHVAVRPFFNNTKANSVGAPVALSWKFGSRLDVDRFEGAVPSRDPLPVGGSVARLANITPSASLAPTHRELHTPHQTSACILDMAATTSSLAVVRETFDPPLDISDFDILTFRLGVMYPDTSSQPKVDAIDQPVFDVDLIDKSGTINSMTSTEIYKDLANGWAKPKIKTVRGADATQMVMQTIAVDIVKLMAPYFSSSSSSPTIVLSELSALEIKFQMPGNASEYWIDEICFTTH